MASALREELTPERKAHSTPPSQPLLSLPGQQAQAPWPGSCLDVQSLYFQGIGNWGQDTKTQWGLLANLTEDQLNSGVLSLVQKKLLII